MVERRRRLIAVFMSICILFVGAVFAVREENERNNGPTASVAQLSNSNSTDSAQEILESLAVKGRAPKTGYAREQFGAGWARVDACDMRSYILQRDLTDVTYASDNCTVLSGTLLDPYTAKTILFQRGADTSRAVQIDHVVALSDAWQKGAQNIDVSARAELANDPLNLLAVDGPTNNKKRDGDAATWLPPDKSYRCRYVARQIAVKHKYKLWVTNAERATMSDVLATCPGQKLPVVQ